MNRERTLLLTSLTLGLISLMVALGAGMHLQHLIDSGAAGCEPPKDCEGGRHLVETVVLIVLALALFTGSVWARQLERKAG